MKTFKRITEVTTILGAVFFMTSMSAYAADGHGGSGVNATGSSGTSTEGQVSTSTGGQGTIGESDAAGATTTGGTNDRADMADMNETAVTGDRETLGKSRTHSEVRDVQSALSGKGYDLQVDGLMGNNTRNAIMRFQKDEGLTESGQIDSETLRALNIQSDRVPSSVPAMPNDTSETPVSPDTDM